MEDDSVVVDEFFRDDLDKRRDVENRARHGHVGRDDERVRAVIVRLGRRIGDFETFEEDDDDVFVDERERTRRRGR